MPTLIDGNQQKEMIGADGTNAGSKGAVPAPSASDNTKYLRGDGTWATVSAGGGTWGSITGTLSNQTDLQSALDAKEDTANKVTSISSSSTDTQYPSAKCVYDIVGNIEATLQAIRGV